MLNVWYVLLCCVFRIVLRVFVFVRVICHGATIVNLFYFVYILYLLNIYTVKISYFNLNVYTFQTPLTNTISENVFNCTVLTAALCAALQ